MTERARRAAATGADRRAVALAARRCARRARRCAPRARIRSVLLPEPARRRACSPSATRCPTCRAARRRAPALPVDVSRTIEDLLTILPLDICHVHEPFAPSTSSAALRHSRALNVGTFHAPTERLLSTQVARKVVQLVLGRLDARTASFDATR